MRPVLFKKHARVGKQGSGRVFGFRRVDVSRFFRLDSRVSCSVCLCLRVWLFCLSLESESPVRGRGIECLMFVGERSSVEIGVGPPKSRVMCWNLQDTRGFRSKQNSNPNPTRLGPPGSQNHADPESAKHRKLDPPQPGSNNQKSKPKTTFPKQAQINIG